MQLNLRREKIDDTNGFSTNHIYNINRLQVHMATERMLLATFAIVAVLGLLGVVIVDGLYTHPVLAASPPFAKCPPGGVAFNASQGRCFHP